MYAKLVTKLIIQGKDKDGSITISMKGSVIVCKIQTEKCMPFPRKETKSCVHRKNSNSASVPQFSANGAKTNITGLYFVLGEVIH